MDQQQLTRMMDQQQLTRKQVMIGFSAGLVVGMIPGIFLFFGNVLFSGTGGPGCCPPDPNYDMKSLLSIILFLIGSMYYLLTFSLMVVLLFTKTLRKLRPVCYGIAIMLTLSLPFAQLLIGSRVWYGTLLFMAILLVIVGERYLPLASFRQKKQARKKEMYERSKK